MSERPSSPPGEHTMIAKATERAGFWGAIITLLMNAVKQMGAGVVMALLLIGLVYFILQGLTAEVRSTREQLVKSMEALNAGVQTLIKGTERLIILEERAHR